MSPISNQSNLPAIEPENVGLSSKRLARIHALMEGYIERQEIPCSITLIARHGKIAHFEVQGSMDIDAKIPAKEDTIFRMFSMTKPITAVAVLMLYEEGYFQLDDPISNFLPEFKKPVVLVSELPWGQRWGLCSTVMTVPANREITIRDCLTHTSGFAQPDITPITMLTAYWDEIRHLGWEDWLPINSATAPSPTMKERIEHLAKLPLCFHPGTVWAYGMSNCVAGVLVEIVSGKSLEEFFKTRIFEPLGMEDSSFYLSENKLSRFATNYCLKNEGGTWKLKVIDKPQTSKKLKEPKIFFSGGGWEGGVLSTASDYARFAQMLLNGGELGTRLLSRKTVELMTTNHTGNLYINSKGYGYGWGLGLGVRTDIVGAPRIGSIGQYGWGGAACTHYFADPKEDLLAIQLSQVTGFHAKPGFNLRENFETMVYQALE